MHVILLALVFMHYFYNFANARDLQHSSEPAGRSFAGVCTGQPDDVLNVC